MAINRASKTYFNKKIVEFASIPGSSPSCIFISYKSEDKDKASRIGDYIQEFAKIDIYLDSNDDGLQGAVTRGDDINIVKFIEKGISTSTHILCLISDKTNVSWWVPYEIGFAKKSNIQIASMKLKTAEDLPSFLKIEKQIFSIFQFNDYLKSIKGTSQELNEEYAKHPLLNYVEPYHVKR